MRNNSKTNALAFVPDLDVLKTMFVVEEECFHRLGKRGCWEAKASHLRRGKTIANLIVEMENEQ